jgi:succinate dehydrogenase / fumarate reductase, cytochrome b subunit
MASGKRPLSPHISIYRWQITMVLSITHRATGIGLVAGALLFAYWLSSAAYSPQAFADAQAVMGSWFGQLVLLGLTASLWFHLANGIRHLAWDAAWGFEMDKVRATGWLVIIAAVVLTAATWLIALKGAM